MKNNILIITSHQNFSWGSMKEIIPNIESSWKLLEDDGYNANIINCDQLKAKELTLLALKADYIVFTCFNLKISKTLKFIRNELSIETPFYFYLHGLATIGMWPFIKEELHILLNENDYFIGTCDGDHNCLKLVFDKPNFTKLKFSLSPISNEEAVFKKFEDPSYVYIGRISPQKNLHSLIWAFYLFKRQVNTSCILEIFGTEDNLGSPNMGMECNDYLDQLIKIISKLNLNNHVHFHGFQNKNEIHTYLNSKKHTIISCSLHSDENFGMSIMRSISLGSQVIISNWGGHREYQTIKKDNSFLNVYQSKFGPYLKINEIVKAFKSLRPKLRSEMINSFSQVKVKNEIKTFLEKDKETASYLLKLNLFKLQEKYSNQTQIFNNYTDELAQDFFEAYGMIFDQKAILNEKNTIVNDTLFDTNIINDPHLGKKREVPFQDLKKSGYVYYE